MLLSTSTWCTRACDAQVRKESDQTKYGEHQHLDLQDGKEQSQGTFGKNFHPASVDEMGRSLHTFGESLAGVIAGNNLWTIMVLLICFGLIICKEMILGLCKHLNDEEARIRDRCITAKRKEWRPLPIVPPVSQFDGLGREWWQLPIMPRKCEVFAVAQHLSWR